MTDETDAPQGGAEGEAIAETPAVETPTQEIADDTPAQQTDAVEIGQADETGEPPAKKKPWWEKRFDELAAQKHEAAREAAYWRGLAEGQKPQQPQAQPESPPDRWEDPEGHDRWLIEQATRAAEEKLRGQQRLSTYGERAAKFTEAHPDFDQLVTANPDLSITPNMANVIFESDYGPQVAYHLGQNPQEARRIAALPDYRQAAELGKLEARLSQPPAKAPARTPPPPPPQTVGGVSAGLTKTLDEMSYPEFVKAREEQEKQRN